MLNELLWTINFTRFYQFLKSVLLYYYFLHFCVSLLFGFYFIANLLQDSHQKDPNVKEFTQLKMGVTQKRTIILKKILYQLIKNYFLEIANKNKCQIIVFKIPTVVRSGSQDKSTRVFQNLCRKTFFSNCKWKKV